MHVSQEKKKEKKQNNSANTTMAAVKSHQHLPPAFFAIRMISNTRRNGDVNLYSTI
ncbi:hypothetical protein CUZ56_01784 [Saezia sanguinis]|uniref:Uncharacterized protein n=1 Tax=Saezia sanguinis TaxID=1965230 RepID=A0A433SCZ6_9BURK|nr:hypothetical protein CUZ56_01784 [Saezia sanguinis]